MTARSSMISPAHSGISSSSSLSLVCMSSTCRFKRGVTTFGSGSDPVSAGGVDLLLLPLDFVILDDGCNAEITMSRTDCARFGIGTSSSSSLYSASRVCRVTASRICRNEDLSKFSSFRSLEHSASFACKPVRVSASFSLYMSFVSFSPSSSRSWCSRASILSLARIITLDFEKSDSLEPSFRNSAISLLAGSSCFSSSFTIAIRDKICSC
mmetsp:Transcript_22421/g.51689  ORF Transcript_22421/g.51689 Transcript_22421/m.51689 type:complete len:211 (-) Transcript_22421:397-1029(-)